ncbi:unnamed protein product [Lupinus luteus]|uniref:Uncharacterized protein n=1 Tax=Lupinus luteus TaxID=3873 RepID=A0AAV1WA28_LUPLU
MDDMTWKFSNTYRPCNGSTKEDIEYPDFDPILEVVTHPFIGGVCSSSSQAWEFSNHPYNVYLRGIVSTMHIRGHTTAFGSGSSPRDCPICIQFDPAIV